MSNSPVRHLGPAAPRRSRDVPPYMAAQYQSNSIQHSQQYSPPLRKKSRRFVFAIF